MEKESFLKAAKALRFRLGMSVKVQELTDVLTDYFGSSSNDKKPLGIKLAECYGFHIGNLKPEETELYEEIVKNLVVLSIQNINILRFHKEAPNAYQNLMFDYSRVFKASIDSKMLIYIKSRINYNTRTFGLDKNHYPKELHTYNKAMVDAYKGTVGKVFAFFDTMEDLVAFAPSKEIVKKMKITDKVQVGGKVLLVTGKYLKNDTEKLLSQRKIVLSY